MFRRTPSRADHGRRVAVDFVVCYGSDGIKILFFFAVVKFEHMASGYERRKAVRVDPVNGLRQPANLPTEYASPTIPTRCNIYSSEASF